jgi:hypothetical protein
MLELRRWTGAGQLYDRFREAGFGLIHYFAELASELCNGSFAPEELLAEQAGQAEAFVYNLFQKSHGPVGHGPLRRRLQNVLAELSPENSRERFSLPLHRFVAAESQAETDDFRITRKVHIRDYAEQLAKGGGYFLRKSGEAPLTRLMVRAYGEWGLYLAFWVDVGGRDRSEPVSAELTFIIGIGMDRGVGSALDLRALAPPIVHYRNLIRPYDPQKLPPPRNAEEISQFAKRAVRAQLRFVELLMADLAENWRA